MSNLREPRTSSSRDAHYQPYPADRAVPPGFIRIKPRLLTADQVASVSPGLHLGPALGNNLYPDLDPPAAPNGSDTPVLPGYLPCDDIDVETPEEVEEQDVEAQIGEVSEEEVGTNYTIHPDVIAIGTRRTHELLAEEVTCTFVPAYSSTNCLQNQCQPLKRMIVEIEPSSSVRPRIRTPSVGNLRSLVMRKDNLLKQGKTGFQRAAEVSYSPYVNYRFH